MTDITDRLVRMQEMRINDIGDISMCNSKRATQATVLIADDNYLIARCFARELERRGYSVTGLARDGIEALELALLHRPDVVVLDLEMPRMGGIETAKALTEEYPVPFVIVSAHESVALTRQANDVGAAGYLVKPVTGSDLARTIELALGRFNELRGLNHSRQGLEILVEERTAQLERANLALQRSLEFKEALLANMSHELRTPLNSVFTLCEVLLEGLYGSLSTRQHRSIATIEESAKRLLSLVDDVLDLGKLQSKTMTTKPEVLNVRSFAEMQLDSFRGRCRGSGHELLLSVDSKIEEIRVDARRVSQILDKLLDNAIRFTPPGGKIGVGIQLTPGGNEIAIAVWDDGPGIHADRIEAALTPFGQGSAGLDRAYDGAGLGLPIAMRLAALLQGRIEVESEVGVGSRFTLMLPNTAL